MSIKVLHAYRTYFPDPPGGLQEAIRQISLSARACDVTSQVFALAPTPEPCTILREEGRVIRSRSWCAPASCDIGGPGAFSLFAHHGKASDVIHYHFPWPFADVLHLLTHPNRPAVMTYHSDLVRQRFLGACYSPLMWRTLKSMKAVVATSPAYARTSRVLSHPVVRDKVRVIPLGIEESSYSSVGDNRILNRLELESGHYFLFVGVLRYYKGIHTLVKAARKLGAKVVIAGSGPEGPKLHALAESEAVANVVFAGQVTDEEKVALLQGCRALVLPSHLRSEAFGMVLVEAAMFGKPMISCEIGTGTSYVNAHEETGFVVEPENPSILADALNTLCADDQLVEIMGAAARRRYETLFSGPALGRAYAALYNEVME